MRRPPLPDDAVAFARRLGVVLKAARVQAGLTQADAAEQLGEGVAIETVSRFERGAVPPSLTWIGRLAALYGTSIDALLGEAVAHPPVVAAAQAALLQLARRWPEGDPRVVLALANAYLQASTAAADRVDRLAPSIVQDCQSPADASAAPRDTEAARKPSSSVTKR